MPSLEVDGFRLVIYTRDERGHKPHVHAIKAGTQCSIRLDDSLEAYDIAKMSRRDVERARKHVGANFGKLVKMWKTYNG